MKTKPESVDILRRDTVKSADSGEISGTDSAKPNAKEEISSEDQLWWE